jgi:DNA-binding Lrp family transcriptional regulator
MKNFKYLPFISFMVGMRSASEIDELILRILQEKGPELSPKELYRELCRRLGPEKRISRVTLYRHMWGLEARKLVEKTRRGWRLNERGFLALNRISELSRFLHECQLMDSGLCDTYASFPNSSVEYYLAAKFRDLMEEVAEEVIRRFYREATIAFLMSQPEEDNILELVQGLGQATITSLMTQRAKQYLEFYDKLLQELGLAIWLGIESIIGCGKKSETLWQTIDRLTKDAEGLDWLSTYLLHGLERVFTDDDAARMFLKVLHHIGFLGELVLLLINQDKQRAEHILSAITGPPQGGEVDWRRLKSFINYLMGLKAAGVITLAANHFVSLAGRIAASEFESWLKALKAGALDHRLWIFGRPPEAPPELKSGREILKTLIKHPEWLQPQDGLDPRREEIFNSRIDLQEPWTLGDLVAYHPRGRDIAFYRELLGEIESRLEANPDLRRKLESLTAGNVDSPRDF